MALQCGGRALAPCRVRNLRFYDIKEAIRKTMSRGGSPKHGATKLEFDVPGMGRVSLMPEAQPDIRMLGDEAGKAVAVGRPT